MLNFIRNKDAFGRPIQLSFNGESEYKTVLGGIATFFAKALLLAFVVSSLMSVFNKERKKEFEPRLLIASASDHNLIGHHNAS